MRHVVEAHIEGQLGQRFGAFLRRGEAQMRLFRAQRPEPAGRCLPGLGKGAVELAARHAQPQRDGIGRKRGIGQLLQGKAVGPAQQAIGGQPDVEPGISHGVMKPGDWIVVCCGFCRHIHQSPMQCA